MHLGELIRNYRAEHNLTMEEFAKLSKLSKPYISMLEKNKNSRNGKPIIPSVTTLKKVATAMNTSFDTLIRELDSDSEINLSTDEIIPTDDEITLIQKYRSLSPEKQEKWKAAAQPAATPDEEQALTLYRQLDDGDRGEIRGTMRQMLKAEKYQLKVGVQAG